MTRAIVGEIIDGVESIVMSLGSDKAASRGKLLGIEPAKVYELRTDVRNSNDAVKKGIASPLSDKPAPAVDEKPVLVSKESSSLFFNRTLSKEEQQIYDNYSKPFPLSAKEKEFVKTPAYRKMLAKHEKKFSPEILAKKQKNRDDLADQRERKREARKTQGKLPKSAISKKEKKEKKMLRRHSGNSLEARKAILAEFNLNPRNSR